MFNLENSILDWRKQMLKAGLKSPVPLDELEIHLREEIEEAVKTGLNESNAFAQAVANTGAPLALKAEFKKSAGVFWWLGATRQERIYRAMAILWGSFAVISMVFSVIMLVQMIFPITPLFINTGTILMLLLLCLYYRVLKCSIRLFKGNAEDRFLIWGLAIFSFLIDVYVSVFRHLEMMACGMMIFSAISIWLLRPKKIAVA